MDFFGGSRPIPITGTWTVTYGAPARVEFAGSSGYFTIRAVTRIQIKGSAHTLPAGIVLGQVRQATPTHYYGEHGLWYVASGQFARWAQMSLTLNGANQLSGRITNDPVEWITFTRLSPISSV